MENNQNVPPQYETVSKFDRIRGNLEGIALFSKPTTIKTVQNVTGKADSFIIETARTPHGDYVFLEYVDETGVTRIVLPPKVTQTMARHSEALSKRNRSRKAKAAMKARMDAGEVLPFQRKKKVKE